MRIPEKHLIMWLKHFGVEIFILLLVIGLLFFMQGVLIPSLSTSVVIALALLGAIIFTGSYIWERITADRNNLKQRLFELIGGGALKVGTFELENRIMPKTASYIVDFSEVFNGPMAQEATQLMASFIREAGVKFDRIAGTLVVDPDDPSRQDRQAPSLIPAIASELKVPNIVIYEYRGKQYPNRTYFHFGQIRPKDRVLIVDDVMTTGQSIDNVVRYLKQLEPSVIVRDAFVFVARPPDETLVQIQRHIAKQGITLHYVTSSKELINSLWQEGFLTAEQVEVAYQDVDFKGLEPPC